MHTINFGGREIEVSGMRGTIIGVFSAKEPVETIQCLNKKYGVEIHPDGDAIILVRPE